MEATQLQRRQRYPQLTKERVKQFRGRIAGSIYSGHFPVRMRVATTPKLQRIPFADAMKLTFRECKVGERFGLSGSTDRDPAVHLQYNITPLVERARAESKGELLLFVSSIIFFLYAIASSAILSNVHLRSRLRATGCLAFLRSLGSITWGLTRLYFNAELTPPPRID
ncbi:hypothetical protein PAPYR_6025 [Paratrimastix pyriformis]|uniref:Uncharacterized protein n=1 Tax=Paratrimastix pyriformis TaxID=342808 RepID=A0ABQ8UG27_9EUKA|nr:hypothetical protein PAPYR_6025 [Paratrimastix pyriformis]